MTEARPGADLEELCTSAAVSADTTAPVLGLLQNNAASRKQGGALTFIKGKDVWGAKGSAGSSLLRVLPPPTGALGTSLSPLSSHPSSPICLHQCCEGWVPLGAHEGWGATGLPCPQVLR